MRPIITCILLTLSIALHAQISNDDVCKYNHLNRSMYRNEIFIPGFDGYQTLKCDFHTHTAFSDGSVWPDIRVNEAWRGGLDAIAITDHIEYRPHRENVVADHNESYRIARLEAEKKGFIVIKGAEITRQKPLGHLNAIFINDANALNVEDPLEAINIANEQGAFIIWNHPGWPDNKSTLYQIHEDLIKSGKIDAYEAYNYMESYPLTFDWYAEYGIAPMANSDIHGSAAEDYGTGSELHRPMTLVFAEERSEDGIRKALEAKRTLAYFQETLVGDREYMLKLLEACLKIRRINDTTIEVTNISDIPYKMSNGTTLYVFPAGKSVIMKTPIEGLIVTNCLWGHGKQLEYSF